MFKAHSSPTKDLSNNIRNRSLPIWGLTQGNLEVDDPKVNCVYNRCKNMNVAATLANDPMLLNRFQPAKASG